MENIKRLKNKYNGLIQDLGFIAGAIAFYGLLYIGLAIPGILIN